MVKYKLASITLVCVSALLIISGCRKDKGNYNYDKLPDFYVEGGNFGGTVSVQQTVEELVIDPKLVYTGDKELDFCWTFFYWGDVESNDTISRSPILRTFVNKPVGSSLRLLFTATEKETGLIVAKEYAIDILAAVPTGWMVAHELGGKTDVDLIRHPQFISGAKDTVFRNLFSSVNGRKLDGAPVSLGSGVRSVNHVLTTAGGATVRYTNFEQVDEYDALISHLSPQNYKPEGIFWYQTTTNVLYNDGVIYSYDNSNAVRMSAKAYSLDKKGYRAAPFYAGSGINAAVFYDALNLRMMYVSYTNLTVAETFERAIPDARFSLDSIGKTVLYLSSGFGTVNGGALVYGFFKDTDNGPSRYLYVMATQRPTQPDVAMIDISTLPEITHAKYYAVGQGGPVAYYATDSRVYLFQINSAGNTVVPPSQPSFEVPPGEVITTMKIYNNSIFWVATWNESDNQGKLYMLSANAASGVLNAIPVATYAQFGRIGAMEFKRY